MPYHTEQYRGFTITVDHDQDAENPRDWHSHVGTMACWHSRYNLGDEQPDKDPDEFLLDLVPDSIKQPFEDRLDRLWRYMRDSRECMGVSYHRCEELLEERKKDACEKWIDQNLFVGDLYLYDHSGITISMGKFSCPWDSGRVGLVYCTLETAKEQFPDLELTDWNSKLQFGEETMTLQAAIGKIIESEVETYDNYLTGEIFCWTIEDEDGDVIESCGGYFGYESADGDCIKDARRSADHAANALVETTQPTLIATCWP